MRPVSTPKSWISGSALSRLSIGNISITATTGTKIALVVACLIITAIAACRPVQPARINGERNKDGHSPVDSGIEPDTGSDSPLPPLEGVWVDRAGDSAMFLPTHEGGGNLPGFGEGVWVSDPDIFPLQWQCECEGWLVTFISADEAEVNGDPSDTLRKE
jgi:hypothetical protein